jgi:glycosyltransferase involved in cell wall biosynthesis
MSVYNGSPDYLRESVDSILNQSFTDFEFIIIDDCSSDDSWSILRKYANRDHRIRLLHNPYNIGLTKSLNRGLHHAKGEYIARQDADDISIPTRLEKQVIWLTQHPKTTLISSEIQRIKPNGSLGKISERTCSSNLLAWHLLFHNHLGGHSQVMFRRQPVLDLGGYNENFVYSQDYELWCRLSKVSSIEIFPEALLYQRFHSSSISASKRSEQTTLVLKQVTLNLKQVLGKVISTTDIENLQRFWSADKNAKAHRFPKPEFARSISNLLAQISEAYVEKNFDSPNTFISEQSLQLIISQKFFAWASSLSLRRQLLEKILIYLIALRWFPKQIIQQKFGIAEKISVHLGLMRLRSTEFKNQVFHKLSKLYKCMSLSGD